MAAMGELRQMTFIYVTGLMAVFFIAQCRGQLFEPTYVINEELPEDSVVGNIGRDSNISHLLSAEDYRSLSYRLLPLSASVINLFTIGNTTGILRTASRIDREALCRFETLCKLVLSAAAQSESGQQFYTIKIYIIVRDINDHHPQFPQLVWPVNIYEDAGELTSIPIIAAVDPDILNNTIQSYSLKPNSDSFELKVSRNLDDSLVPQLYVKFPLNRETRPFYLLKIVAMDGGSPRRSGELTVNVSVLDVNDNPPRFTQQTYDVSVEEDKPIGHRVIILSATDDDIGANGRVKFQLGARQNEEAFKTFRVIPESGYIVTLRELTSLQGETMKLVVEAVDGGTKPLTAQAMVNIHILDSINNAPTIRMTFPYGSRTAKVMENASPGLVIAHFIVDDPDSGENGVVTCQLNDDTFGLQRLKESEYKVTVYSVLDREHKSLYDVTITCSDGGHPPMSTNMALAVVLQDANDNPPRFLRQLYLANVTENTPGGFVLRVEAEDADQNQKVTYRLGNVTSLVTSYIHVNSSTGDIRTKQKLDHELFRELSFFVVATDDGTPSLSSSVRVVISVIDENDNTPSVPSDFFLTIQENMPAGTLVGHINAIDPDEGPGGEVGYQLLTDNEAPKLFNLSEAGEVRALMPFDRETRDIYDINVLARDFGAAPMTNVLHIRIFITDANDHKPVFEFPRMSNRTVHTTIDSRFNSTVARVVASDKDYGRNATLTYSIIDGAKDVFEIEPRTGRIYVMRHLYGKDKGTYDVSLFVHDNGSPTLSETATLTIVVSQGNSTVIFAAFGYNEQMTIVAVLVAFTVIIAVVVFLIVLRFVKKDRRDRRPKYTSGLPLEIKKRSPTPEDDASSDEGPWRRYDEAKRPNGHVVTSGDVSYDANDDIIMFKLKLSDQYKELEPEDKDHHGGALACSDSGSNRNSVISDVDGAPDVCRDRNVTRLATFQANLPMLQVSAMSSNAADSKVWRSPPKEKMADEILSSSSRETTGADSGRGPSEDGSQSRSSVTDDSGCLISPSHSILRGGGSKGQGNYSRPPSGSGFDRPPFLMTFQSTSESAATSGATANGNGGNSSSGIYGSRKDYGGNPTSPRPVNYYSSKSGDKLKKHDKDAPGSRIYSESGNEQDRYKETTLKKCIDDGYVSNGSTNHKSFNYTNGFKKSTERLVNPASKSRDSRLCSEPPGTGPKGQTSPSYNTPMQETGLTPSPSPVSPSMLYTTNSRPIIPRSADTTLRSDHSLFKYPPSPSYLQSTSPSPHSFKQASCPQLYKNGGIHDPHSQGTLPASNRSRPFNAHENSFSTTASRSIQDILSESAEGQEDSNTTTTSGSYTIDQEELTVELPPTDVFV